jgi:hypothetical protein
MLTRSSCMGIGQLLVTIDLEWFPPHRVKKVKVKNGAESSDYRDTKKAT